jgi:hypothetical protein
MNTDAEGNGSEFFPFMAAVLPCFTYAEKLTVMFSEEVVLSQRNKIQIESEICAKNRRKLSDERWKAETGWGFSILGLGTRKTFRPALGARDG